MLAVSNLWAPMGLAILGAKYSHASALSITHHPYYNASLSSPTTSSLSTAIVSSRGTPPERESSSSERWTKPTYTTPDPGTQYTCTTHSKKRTTTISVPVPVTTYSIPVSHRHTTFSTTCNTTTIVPVTVTPSPTYVPPPTSESNPCPTTCSISAGTVELFYWPTGNDFAYPTTFVDTALDYTFTQPSVYMMVDTIYGYNSFGRIGPSATSKVFALDLDEVSTIVPDSGATRQLTLNDLGTDCPQSAEPSVIATMVRGGRCDPILAAPSAVKSWASPCGACGNFGLFDPPYAIPTVTGSLLGGTTTSVVETTPTPTPATSVETIPTATAAPTTAPTTPSSTPTVSSTPVVISSSAPSSVQTAGATQGTGGISWLILSFLASIMLL